MELAVSSRTKLGKGAKTLRAQGVIPAVLYGHGIENKNLSVDRKAFLKVFGEAGENTVIQLVLEGGTTRPALIHDVVRDYLKGDVSHIDFYEVRMDEEIEAPIPIEFTGESPAAKELGGILTRSMEHIEVEALPANLPQSFALDLSPLKELNQSLYVKDLRVPKGVKVLVDPETVIVTVGEPMKEEVVPVAPVVDVSAVKVETEEKKEERAKEKETGKEASAAPEAKA